jgi:hypothetical protein
LRSELIIILSDHFIKSDGRHTPWNEAFCRAAYLAYFTPLNVVRLSGVLRELAHLDYFSGIDCVEECGSGAGALALAFAGELSRGTVPQLFCSDGDSWAATAHEELSDVACERREVSRPPKRTLARTVSFFSCVFTELEALPTWSQGSEGVIVVEPSTRTHFQRLAGLRKDLIKNGWSLWSPCPHEDNCPLADSRDWCHDAIVCDQPSWFRELERYLPMKNQRVTYSFLAARKTAREKTLGAARVVGDVLISKGTSKQMICRGPEREFISWLHRNAEKDWGLKRGDFISLHTREPARNGLIRVTPDAIRQVSK